MLLCHAQHDGFPQAGPRPETVETRFGLRLRALREARGLTQAQFASMLNMDRSFLSDIERGKRSPSLTCLGSLSRGFELSLSELVRGL